MPAIVTASVRRGRARFAKPGRASDVPWWKTATHRRHRRAWRRWCADPERDEPCVKPLTSWELW